MTSILVYLWVIFAIGVGYLIIKMRRYQQKITRVTQEVLNLKAEMLSLKSKNEVLQTKLTTQKKRLNYEKTSHSLNRDELVNQLSATKDLRD